MEKHYMIDIETTGVDKLKDSILEIGVVEIDRAQDDPYWHLTGRVFHKILHYSGEPESVFAKKHMADLYKKCNEVQTHIDYANACTDLTLFIHEGSDFGDPKFFMGWNASNFDIPFLFAKKILGPSYYEKISETKEKLRGDVHYRIYEQTGALNYVLNMTGLNKKAIMALASTLDPTGITLPEGKYHDALYDCYSQIVMMNGLIAIGRHGFKV